MFLMLTLEIENLNNDYIKAIVKTYKDNFFETILFLDLKLMIVLLIN